MRGRGGLEEEGEKQ